VSRWHVTRKGAVSTAGWLGLAGEFAVSVINHVPPEPTLTLVFAAAAGIPIAKFLDDDRPNNPPPPSGEVPAPPTGQGEPDGGV
jgi:hypothetical protein